MQPGTDESLTIQPELRGRKNGPRTGIKFAMCAACGQPIYQGQALATLIQFDTITVEFCGRCLNKPIKMLLLETQRFRKKHR